MRTLTTTALLSALLLAGCSSQDSAESSASVDSGAGAADVSQNAAADENDANAGDATSDAPSPANPGAGEDASAPNVATNRTPEFGFDDKDKVADDALKNYHVAMTCTVGGEDVGGMTIAVWGDEAPITSRNFLRLCDEGFYDGLTFHRIMRDFMVQGGDPQGNGMGDSPYGSIEAEFSEDPARAHGYGVLSMARGGHDVNSASSQFFICCDESPSVWGLDGQYTSFGKITSGVATLEALADTPTNASGREMSAPAKRVVITRAEVVEGPAPTGEEIARPIVDPDLGGEPRSVVIQHVLVSFAGIPRISATRTKEEAEALAADLLEKARAGDDFDAMVREYSSDPVQEGDDTPGVYRMLNKDIRDREGEKAMHLLTKELQPRAVELREKQAAQEITAEEARDAMAALQTEFKTRSEPFTWTPRTRMVKAFGDVAFSLKVGEVGTTVHDADDSPYGWHIIKRLE